MFKLCKYQNCAVCNEIKDREVFKYILKTVHPETYVCKNAAYAIKSFLGGEFIISSLEFVKHGSNGYYVLDMYTGRVLYLNANNVTIICTKQGRTCEQKPFEVDIEPQKEAAN